MPQVSTKVLPKSSGILWQARHRCAPQVSWQKHSDRSFAVDVMEERARRGTKSAKVCMFDLHTHQNYRAYRGRQHFPTCNAGCPKFVSAGSKSFGTCGLGKLAPSGTDPVPERKQIIIRNLKQQQVKMAAMYATLFICCLASAPFAMAGQQSATAAGTARKLLGSPSMGMMGMSTSPMMMGSPMMMSPAMSPMSKPMMYNLTLTPSMEVPAVRPLSSILALISILPERLLTSLPNMSFVRSTIARFCGCHRASVS